MTVLLERHLATPGAVRGPVKARRRTGEIRRPPTRARIVAGRRPSPVPGCSPRRVLPRWPWLAAAGLAVALIFTGLGVFANGMAGGEVPARTATVTVGDGESLWELARQYAPDADAAAVVARIRELNGLDERGDTTVVPGLPLTVPVEAQPPGDGS